MTWYDWLVYGGAALTLGAFAISLTSWPERFAEWRRRAWETDSDGTLPEE